MVHVSGALWETSSSIENGSLMAIIRNQVIRGNNAIDDVFVVDVEASWALESHWLCVEFLLVADGSCTTNVSESKTLKLFNRVRLLRAKIILSILLEPWEDWNEKQCDEEEHLAKVKHHVEVGVDTETQNQEWVLNELGLALWHLHIHFLHQWWPESELKVLVVTSLQAPLKLRQNVMWFSKISQRMIILHSHENLIHLLSRQSIRGFPFAINEWLVVVAVVSLRH